MAERDTQRFDFIDALRGLAIMEVVLNHTALWIAPVGKTVPLLAQNGARGVELFFVVSALSLFLSYGAKRATEARPVRNFYLRRLFRLAPMYYLAIVLYLVLDGGNKSYFAPLGVQWWHVILNVLFLNGWLPETFNEIVPGSWSIAVTFTFSLLLPLLYVRLKDIKSSLLFLAVSVVLGYILTAFVAAWLREYHAVGVPVLIKMFANFWFFAQLPAFAIGILVFQVIGRKKTQPDRALGYILFLISVILCIADLSATTFHSLLSRDSLYAIAFGILAVALFNARIRLVVNPVICWIGRISYSIYFLHSLVLRLLRYDVFPGGFPIPGNRGLLVAAVITLVLSSAFAWITYQFVELPFIQLGRRLIQRLETPAAVPDVAV